MVRYRGWESARLMGCSQRPSHASLAYASTPPALLLRDIAPLVCKLLELSSDTESRATRENTEAKERSPALTPAT